MKKRTRLLSLLLALALCLTLLPAGLTVSGSTADITLGTGGISAQDTVYFGSYDGSPIKWYVYGVDTRSATLASYDALYTSAYHSTALYSDNKGLTYADTDLYAALVTEFQMEAGNFSSLEQAQMSNLGLPTTAMALSLPPATLRYWLAAIEHDSSYWYGYTYETSGSVSMTQPLNWPNYVRPVFDLSLSSNILFTQKYSSGTTLTLLDSNRAFQIGTIAVDGNTLTIGYTGASVGPNEYICAMVVDSSNAVTYYSTLTQPTSTTGTLDVSLTDVGYNSSGDTLYLFTQQCNGEYYTDYASRLQAVSTTRDATYIAYDLSNITSTNTTVLLPFDSVYNTSEYYYTCLSAGNGYCLPNSVSLVYGSQSLSIAYDRTTGALTIASDILTSKGNPSYITITAVAYSATQAPTITGIVDGGSYCGSVEFTVTDDDLETVALSDGVDYATLTPGQNGTYTVTWTASQSGSADCTILAIDEQHNSTPVSFTLYSDHEWDTTNPDWEWATDGTSATVTFYCSHNSADSITIAATSIISAETIPATAYADGVMTYTASVSFNGAAYTDSSYTAIIPALGTTTLSFDVNGGWGMNDITVGVGESIDLTKYAATRYGYTFTSWYADSVLTQPITSLTVGTSPITIYAGWEPVVYTWEIPITLTVTNAASVNALPEDFTLEMYDGSGDPFDLSAMDITILNGSTTISTDGAMQYTATLTFSSYVATESDLSDGFYLQLGIGNSYGWVYDDTIYTIFSHFDDDTGVQTECDIYLDYNSGAKQSAAAFNVYFTGYTLTFQTNGGTSIDSVEAGAGTPIALSAYIPTRSGLYLRRVVCRRSPDPGGDLRHHDWG